jgi:hypothetical protein
MTADLRYMLTLTYRENIADYERTRGHVAAFLAHFKRVAPGFTYVGAPELQKRGAWHWHLLLRDRLDAVGTRATWQVYSKTRRGDSTINLRYFDDPVKGALYAAKYVRKGFGEFRVPGVRYLRSRNIEVTSVKLSESEATEALGQAGWSGEVFPLDTGGWWAASWR